MSTSQPVPTALVAPIIEAYVQGIRPAFSFILISAVFSAILVPLLILLFALSTPKTRRGPLFILNVLAVLLGIVVGVLCGHLTIHSVLSPFAGINSTEDLVYNILYIWMPWLVEAVLLLRVVAIYRSPRSSRPTLLAIIAFPISIKIVRAAIFIKFLVLWHQNTFSGGVVNQFSTTDDLTTIWTKIAWILELVDNAYISFIFLWRLAVEGHFFDKSNVRVVESSDTDSFTNRIQSLFWIASTNFVFPLIFGLCQIVILFVGKNVLLAASIEMANVYISIISTALATIWSSTRSFKDAMGYSVRSSSHGNEPHESIVFNMGSMPSVSTEIKGKDGRT